MEKIKEQIHTKIEEYRETINPNDYTVSGMVERMATYATITGLELALQIIEENEDGN